MLSQWERIKKQAKLQMIARMVVGVLWWVVVAR